MIQLMSDDRNLASSASRLAEFGRDKMQDWTKNSPLPAMRKPSMGLLTGAAAIAMAMGAAYYFGPDLVRYMKIRRM